MIINTTRKPKYKTIKHNKNRFNCKQCQSFKRIWYNNKKVPYCQYWGRMYPKKICGKFIKINKNF